jgi:hypothetical protein
MLFFVISPRIACRIPFFFGSLPFLYFSLKKGEKTGQKTKRMAKRAKKDVKNGYCEQP